MMTSTIKRELCLLFVVLLEGGHAFRMLGSRDRVDATGLITSADKLGIVRCCCDLQTGRQSSSNRSGLCVLVRDFPTCAELPKTSWAAGALHHYVNVGGKCWLSENDAQKAEARYAATRSDDVPEFPEFKHLIEIGPGFWNVRAPLQMYGLELGTHMSFARLSDGNIVAIDTVNLTEQPGLKEEIDTLTNNGKKLTAVLGTHPFHTLFFPGFHAMYPATAERQYYAAPRIVSRYPDIQWAGNITSVFEKWPDLEMLLPEGGEWVAPKPEKTNHLMNVFVLHKPSKTVHNDDTILVMRKTKSVKGKILSLFVKEFKPGMHFHFSLWKSGLYPTRDSPRKFQASIERLLNWDFENLLSAHNGNSLGDAKAQVRQLLNDSKKKFQQLADKFAKREEAEKK